MFPVTLRLYKMILWLHTEMRPKLLDAIYRREGNARIIHIRSPRALAALTGSLVRAGATAGHSIV